eukprot:scaffold323803_cov31-Tisochrysis_lutea.AAC.2
MRTRARACSHEPSGTSTVRCGESSGDAALACSRAPPLVCEAVAHALVAASRSVVESEVAILLSLSPARASPHRMRSSSALPRQRAPSASAIA